MKSSAASSNFTVDVFALARTSGHCEGRMEIAAMERLAPLLTEASGTVQWALDGSTDARGRPAAQLTLHAKLSLACDKCGSDLQMPVDVAADFWFVRNSEELESLPVDVVDEEPLIGNSRFSVAQLVEDELILAIPISPRHPRCETGADAESTLSRCFC
jgi:uncharacterized protein